MRLFTIFSSIMSSTLSSTLQASTSISMFNQYASSDLISYFSLSVVIDAFCILITSMLENNLLVYLLLVIIYILFIFENLIWKISNFSRHIYGTHTLIIV
jgi:hypothetical protein